MADRVWVGTTGAWDLKTNWNPNPSANGPLDGENAHFTGDSVQDVDGITLANLEDALGGIFVHPDYTGSIGSSGSKIIADQVDVIRFASQGGKLFLEVQGDEETPVNGDIDDVVVNTPAGLADMLEVKGRISRLNIVGTTGSITMTAGTNGPQEIMMVDSPNCILTIETNVSGIERIRMNSGRIICNSLITAGTGDLIVTGGVFQHKVGAITNIFLSGSGVIEYTSPGAITNFFGMGPGSLFDGRRNRGTAINFGSTRAELWPGCTVLLRNALDSYVLPSIGVVNFGGILDLETGRGIVKQS